MLFCRKKSKISEQLERKLEDMEAEESVRVAINSKPGRTGTTADYLSHFSLAGSYDQSTDTIFFELTKEQILDLSGKPFISQIGEER